MPIPNQNSIGETTQSEMVEITRLDTFLSDQLQIQMQHNRSRTRFKIGFTLSREARRSGVRDQVIKSVLIKMFEDAKGHEVCIITPSGSGADYELHLSTVKPYRHNFRDQKSESFFER